MKEFLIMFFVLTPIAAIQTAVAGTTLFAILIPGEYNWIYIIVGVILTILLNMLTYRIRYDDPPNIFFFILDVPLAVLRLPLQLISDVLLVISWFTRLRVDPQCKSYYEFDGIKNMILLHYLQFKIEDYGKHYREVKRREARKKPSKDPREYKMQNIWHQLVTWIFTLIHSVGVCIALACIWDYAGQYDHSLLGVLLALAVTLAVYIYFAIASGVMKGMRGADEWYDNETVTRVTIEYDWWRDEYKPESKVIKEAGWRTELTPGMIIYIILGLLWVIPQTITLIIAIVTPPGSAILPCRGTDLGYDGLSFKNKFTLFFFGFITRD